METSLVFARSTLLADLEKLENAIHAVNNLLRDNSVLNGERPVDVFDSMKRLRDAMWAVNTPANLSFMRMVPGSSQVFENELLKMAY